jgi:signal transduction histidine kinase
MLGALHADGGAGERVAQPGLEQLPALVDRVRTTGLAAQLTVSGPAAELTPAVSSSLLRIAQESVTNALRHARASAIAIDVVVGTESVQLSVADDGIGYDDTQGRADHLDPQRRGGRGLLGMRERARAMSGSLEVSAGADRGTVVTVRFPRSRDGRT